MQWQWGSGVGWRPAGSQAGEWFSCNEWLGELLRFAFVDGQDVVRTFGRFEFGRARGAIDRVTDFERIAGDFVDGGQLLAPLRRRVHGFWIAALGNSERSLSGTIFGFKEVFVALDLELDVGAVVVGDLFPIGHHLRQRPITLQ